MSQKTTWALDPAHTEIGFKVKHMMFTNVSGKISKYDATIETAGDQFEDAVIDFTGDATSFTTGNADRDTHLLSADFFDVAQFPEMKFVATSFVKADDDNYDLEGDLSLHGITNPIKLQAEFGGLMKDPWGNIKAAFSITGKLKRKDWGLTWNAALETGGVLVGEDVRIIAEVQLIKQ
jgi:polyisoprenoid-binding protein YceI